jgi:hypothetical protein
MQINATGSGKFTCDRATATYKDADGWNDEGVSFEKEKMSAIQKNPVTFEYRTRGLIKRERNMERFFQVRSH